MGSKISRRDFLDGVAIGVGAMAVGGAGDTLLSARVRPRRAHPDPRRARRLGGHARRNEFRAGGRTIVGYGGSQSLESPSTFSAPAKRLLEDIDIEVKRFEKYYDAEFTARHGLGRALFFDKESWGRDHFVSYGGDTNYAEILKDAPMAAQAKVDLARIFDAPEDWMAGMTDAQKKDRLAAITYLQYLTDHVKAHPDAIKFLQTTPNGNWGYGADAVGALDASIEFAGFDGLNLDWDTDDQFGGYQAVFFQRDPTLKAPRGRSIKGDRPVNGVYRAASDFRTDGQAVGW